MSAPSTLLRRLLSYGLIGSGAIAILSGLVNALAAYQLIDAAEEQSLGITRLEIFRWCAALFAAGVLLVYLGLRRRK